jgi:hypothetical protein
MNSSRSSEKQPLFHVDPQGKEFTATRCQSLEFVETAAIEALGREQMSIAAAAAVHNLNTAYNNLEFGIVFAAVSNGSDSLPQAVDFLNQFNLLPNDPKLIICERGSSPKLKVLVCGPPIEYDGTTFAANDDYHEKFLRNLGVLKDEQNLGDFKKTCRVGESKPEKTIVVQSTILPQIGVTMDDNGHSWVVLNIDTLVKDELAPSINRKIQDRKQA